MKHIVFLIVFMVSVGSYIPNVVVASSQAHASIFLVNAQGIGAEVGNMSFSDTDKGLRIETSLADLPPGLHGMHIHEKGECGSMSSDGRQGAALSAGSHYDPKTTKRHEGPQGMGHAGDLPVLFVNAEGNTSQTLYAPRLQVAEIIGRSVIIHANNDNFSDEPKPLGGSGARIACGAIR